MVYMKWSNGDTQTISVNVDPSADFSKTVKVACVKQNMDDDSASGIIYSQVATNEFYVKACASFSDLASTTDSFQLDSGSSCLWVVSLSTCTRSVTGITAYVS